MNPFSYWTSIPTVALFMSLRWQRKETLFERPSAWADAETVLWVVFGLAALLSCIALVVNGYRKDPELRWWTWTAAPESAHAKWSNAAFVGYAVFTYSFTALLFIFPPDGSGNHFPAIWLLLIEFARQRVETKRRGADLMHA